MDKFAVAGSYLHPYEAHVAKSSLLEGGINAIIENEHAIGLSWFYGQNIGGVRVLVPRESLEEAKEILNTDFSENLAVVFGTDTD